MDTARRLVLVGAICLVCSVASHTKEGGGVVDPNDATWAGVTISLTNLEVTDSSLDLSYEIRNDSDHEAWMCSESGPPFEVFLALDTQTLVIRKRMDVPDDSIWDRGTPVGTYVRIVPGASLTESVQTTLPVTPRITYSAKKTTEVAQTVTRLALEIGYFDEDLPTLIHTICAIADTCSIPSGSFPSETINTYFRGVVIRGSLGRYFDRLNPDPYGAGRVRIFYPHGLIEEILRADVNDVSIPYEGHAVIKYCE